MMLSKPKAGKRAGGDDGTHRQRNKEARPVGRARTLLLLAGDRLGLALTSARIGVRALAANRQALAMAQAAIAGEVHQPLDVHRRVAAQVALARVVGDEERRSVVSGKRVSVLVTL